MHGKLLQSLALSMGVLPADVRAQYEMLADQEQTWHQAVCLGVPFEEVKAYDACIVAYAAKMPHSNQMIWRAAWQVAIESLKKGEGLPELPQ
jgi:hypothetical protein